MKMNSQEAREKIINQIVDFNDNEIKLDNVISKHLPYLATLTQTIVDAYKKSGDEFERDYARDFEESVKDVERNLENVILEAKNILDGDVNTYFGTSYYWDSKETLAMEIESLGRDLGMLVRNFGDLLK